MSDWTPLAFFIAPGIAVAFIMIGSGGSTYLEGRAIAVAINAAARLAEAENARRALPPSEKGDGHG